MDKKKKKVNVKVMEKVSTLELSELVESLKKIKDFDFFVEVQFTID